jgi:Tfp pilus assembly ATPase PilU
LYELYKQGTVTEEEAIRWADSANNLRIKIRMEKVAAGTEEKGPQLKLSRDR